MDKVFGGCCELC